MHWWLTVIYQAFLHHHLWFAVHPQCSPHWHTPCHGQVWHP